MRPETVTAMSEAADAIRKVRLEIREGLPSYTMPDIPDEDNIFVPLVGQIFGNLVANIELTGWNRMGAQSAAFDTFLQYLESLFSEYTVVEVPAGEENGPHA